MASRRITNDLKTTIWENMRKKVFGERLKTLSRNKVEFADFVYGEMYTEDQIKMMKEAPDGAFVMSNTVKFHNDSGNRKESTMSVARPFFYIDSDNWKGRFFPNASHVFVKNEIIFKKSQEIEKEERKLHSSVMSAMAGITTLKKLLEVWPEVTNYLPSEDAPVYLPAIPFAGINEMIAAMTA